MPPVPAEAPAKYPPETHTACESLPARSPARQDAAFLCFPARSAVRCSRANTGFPSFAGRTAAPCAAHPGCRSWYQSSRSTALPPLRRYRKGAAPPPLSSETPARSPVPFQSSPQAMRAIRFSRSYKRFSFASCFHPSRRLRRRQKKRRSREKTQPAVPSFALIWI